MLLLERWQLKCMVYRCLQRPMYILLTTLHNQLCHPLSTCKQSPEALQAKHPISVPADCRDCELRNIITFPLFKVSIQDTTCSSHTTVLFTNWQLFIITLHRHCYLNMVCIATVAVPYRGGDAPTKNFPTPILFSADVFIMFCCCIVGMAFIRDRNEVWCMCGMRHTLPHLLPHQIWSGAAIANSPSPHHKTWTYYGVENL